MGVLLQRCKVTKFKTKICVKDWLGFGIYLQNSGFIGFL
jgi:hypothetical protein